MSHAIGHVYLAACGPGMGDASAQFNAPMPALTAAWLNTAPWGQSKRNGAAARH
jgi:hypothetical protein